MANKQSSAVDEYTWIENPDDIIVLANRSNQNFILDLPAGRYRLDAGRRMRTMRSILKFESVMELVQAGKLAIE
jgi:hypothetical protein